MVIQSATPRARLVRSAAAPGPDPDKQPDPPKPNEKVKQVVTGAAFTATGAAGGLVLGGLGGKLLTNLTGNPVFDQLGSATGAIAGAASGVAAYGSENPSKALTRSLVSWGLATAGTAAGTAAVGEIARNISANGGAAFIGANGPLLGALAGGLTGASLGMLGVESTPSEILKQGAWAAAGGTIGLLVGGGIQCVANPVYAYTVAAAPVLGAVTGALLGATIALHRQSILETIERELS